MVHTCAMIAADIPYDVGFQLMKWVYTDEIAEKQNEDFLLNLMKTAKRFELRELIDQYVDILFRRDGRGYRRRLDAKWRLCRPSTFEIA